MFSLNKKIVFAWLVVLLWMTFIFYLSHQPATESSELSKGITDSIVKIIQKTTFLFKLDFEFFHHLIRKSAHFFAYFILGLLSLDALMKSKKDGYGAIVTAFVICVIYAITDEVHQLFIPGRSGEVTDVFIDSVGSSTGIGLYWLMSKIIFRKKKKAQRTN